ncbi:hypothetical protein JCM5353_002746 [Sporobolomyces roseus]
METYASRSLESINWFSTANKEFFPKHCNPLGFTDVDAYCATSTSVFVWACLTYALAACGFNLAPSAIWGIGIMQIMNANAFMLTGFIRVKSGAAEGGMTRWHTKFLFPQALGLISIMGATTFAPQWMRLGRSEVSIENEVRLEKGPNAKRSDVRSRERSILRKSKSSIRWTYFVVTFWFANLSAWTALYFWFSYGDIKYSQSNCENVIEYVVSPDVATLVLGLVAWLLLAADCFVVYTETGLSDWLIDRFYKNGEDIPAIEHRKIERRLTQGVTIFLYFLWFGVNLTIYYDGYNSFLLSGADLMSFGQVEQMTALLPDLLGFAVAAASYLSSRDELNVARIEYAARQRVATRNATPAVESEEDSPPDSPKLELDIDQNSLWPSVYRRGRDSSTSDQELHRSPSTRSRFATLVHRPNSTRSPVAERSSAASHHAVRPEPEQQHGGLLHPSDAHRRISSRA